MNVGKLTNDQLNELIFSKIKNKRKELITGPEVGKDCAVLDLADNYILISTDPITGTEKKIGKLCVNVCANDIAAAGGEPVAMLVSMLIPPSAHINKAEEIVEDILETCARLNIDLVGGHTEVSGAVNRFVLTGISIGKRAKTAFERVNAGDKLVMSKTAGLEGTGIIAEEVGSELSEILTKDELNFALGTLDMISVVKEGLVGRDSGAKLMHDATEGGVLGAAWEMAYSSGLGVSVFADHIPVSPVTQKICAHYGIDPLRLISSGVMLFCVKNPEVLIDRLKKEGVEASLIGEFISAQSVISLNGEMKPLEPPVSDELYKVIK